MLIADSDKVHSQRDEYFNRVKSIYQGSKNTKSKANYSRNSQYSNRNVSFHVGQRSAQGSPNRAKPAYTSSTGGIELIHQSAQQPSSLANSKLRTENQDSSPRKKFFHTKAERQRRFQNSVQNDRMQKRLNQIRNRQNRYMKDSLELIQFEKEHKMMHESSVLANRKLLQMEIEEKNTKFVDQMVERVKYKQTIKQMATQKMVKCVKLDESRANVAFASRNVVQLPPMVFE